MELSVFSLVYLLHAVNISRHRYPDRTFSSNVNIREVYYDSKQGHFLSPGFPVRDGCENSSEPCGKFPPFKQGWSR